LNYESGKFSKSKGIGVFGTDAMESGIPADVWRFYIYYNRPERSDALFTWKDFQEKVNGELIGNLANLVNRAFSFVHRYFGGELPADIPQDAAGRAFWQEAGRIEEGIGGALERVELRDAFRAIFSLSSLGNKRFQDEEPWKKIKESRESVLPLLRDLVYLIRDLAILVQPYLPQTSRRIGSFLGLEDLAWDQLGRLSGVGRLARSELLFKILEDDEVEQFRSRYAGSQSEREQRAQAQAEAAPPDDPADRFRSRVCIRVGRIVSVERHPKADKLYVETVDLGGEQRRIVSGLVPYYREEELLGRNILLVVNLKPARLRGVESQGMLLAAEDESTVEVLFADHAQPGDPAALAEEEPAEPAPAGAQDVRRASADKDVRAPAEYPEIDIDEFLTIPIQVRGRRVLVGGRELQVRGRPVDTVKVEEGKVK
jgi:methionyl-tRNA synthetase